MCSVLYVSCHASPKRESCHQPSSTQLPKEPQIAVKEVDEHAFFAFCFMLFLIDDLKGSRRYHIRGARLKFLPSQVTKGV